ncbi:hypothetical protein J437_LFUL001020 [Ladona fulva]|uniref:RING-type domain-containing protein n=1 Tax=Ladona fulva TaxID=123851 RepID=A0A8K0KG58_LADFU|nr:hypothetical protein J437_LFUL001020 [Ladona fulva]
MYSFSLTKISNFVLHKYSEKMMPGGGLPPHHHPHQHLQHHHHLLLLLSQQQQHQQQQQQQQEEAVNAESSAAGVSSGATAEDNIAGGGVGGGGANNPPPPPPHPRNPLLCYVCDDYYKEPCLLACFHTFCARCLHGHEIDGKITCPLCGQQTVLKDGTNVPPPDTLIRQLVELSDAENPPCANCDKRNKTAMYFCNTCACG